MMAVGAGRDRGRARHRAGLFRQKPPLAHTLVADAQQKQPQPIRVVGVSDQMTIKDDTVEIRLQKIANPHFGGMLIGHVVQPNVVWVRGIWSPDRDAAKTPGVIALDAAVKKLGITGATFGGGHGNNAKQDQLNAIMASN